MLITSHLLGTLLTAKLLSIHSPELYIAILSGVGVDVDHFFVNRKWIQDIKDFISTQKISYGINQHSWMQELLFGTIAGAMAGFLISYAFPTIRWWIFPAFLLLHIAMDGVMHNEHRPFVPFNKFKYWGWIRSGTKQELIISLAGLIAFYFFSS